MEISGHQEMKMVNNNLKTVTHLQYHFDYYT